MQEAWRNYLELALGATETSRRKATKVVRELVGKGGATAEQLQELAGDLLAAGSTNREGIAKLVRYEVDRALGRVGLATAEEVGHLTARVRELESELNALRGATGSGRSNAAREADASPPAPAARTAELPDVAVPGGDVPGANGKKAVAKKAVAKKAVAKKAVANKSAAGASEPAPTAPAGATKSGATKSGATKTAKKAQPTTGRVGP